MSRRETRFIAKPAVCRGGVLPPWHGDPCFPVAFRWLAQFIRVVRRTDPMIDVVARIANIRRLFYSRRHSDFTIPVKYWRRHEYYIIPLTSFLEVSNP